MAKFYQLSYRLMGSARRRSPERERRLREPQGAVYLDHAHRTSSATRLSRSGCSGSAEIRTGSEAAGAAGTQVSVQSATALHQIRA
jgi:hypothetical protein